MKKQKTSLDMGEDLYLVLKRDALERRTTMSRIIRELLTEKYKIVETEGQDV